jgi:phosphate/sulfate permease
MIVLSVYIIGMGVVERSGVRWRFVTEMVLAWLVTLPVSGVIAGGVYMLVA